MRRTSQRGVTLMELLIAVTLVSLVATGLLFAMRVGINAMESSERRIQTNRRTVGAHRILEEQAGGFIPVVALCRPPGMMFGGSPIPFFQGTPQVMRFVSTYSLREARRGAPRILTFFVIPGENNEGVRLVVNEDLYTSPFGAGQFCYPPRVNLAAGVPLPLVGFPEPQAGTGTFVIADRLASCRFIFLERIPDQAPPNFPQKWVPFWVLLDQWPEAFRIEMSPLEPNPARVQPMSFTAAFRVTRAPLDPNAIQ